MHVDLSGIEGRTLQPLLQLKRANAGLGLMRGEDMVSAVRAEPLGGLRQLAVPGEEFLGAALALLM